MIEDCNLAPCPFCKSIDLVVLTRDSYRPDYHVQCKTCGGSGPTTFVFHNALKAWNGSRKTQLIRINL